MKLNPLIYLLVLLLLTFCTSPPAEESEEDLSPVENESSKYYQGTDVREVSYQSADGFTIFADLVEQDKSKTSIILFHQAGANARGEYRTILPKLVNKGYNVLAVDQRTGGQLFGHYNRTIDLLTTQYGYCDAYPDFEASVNFMLGNEFSGPIIVWGSSYSAALVVKLAHENDDVDAALAFSPASGDPMEGCRPDAYFETLSKPVLALRPQREMEYPSAAAQLEKIRELGHSTYVSDNGVHGSSMLDPSRVQGPVDAHWQVVFDFLDAVE